MESFYLMFLQSVYSETKTFQIARMSKAYFLLQACVGRERTCAVICPEAEARHLCSAHGKTDLEVNFVVSFRNRKRQHDFQ